jgi:hypothetical protein
MIAGKSQIVQAAKSGVKTGSTGKKARSIVFRSLIIAIGASLTLPSCSSHKLCEAYSNATLKKNKTGGSTFSSNFIIHAQI